MKIRIDTGAAKNYVKPVKPILGSNYAEKCPWPSVQIAFMKISNNGNIDRMTPW